MHPDHIRELLEDLHSGKIEVDQAFQQLATLPFSDLGDVKVDNHRALRCGFAEVIFCAGKEPRDVVRIIDEGLRGAPCMLATRANKAHLDAIRERYPAAVINARGGTARVGKALSMKTRGGVMVVTAGTSDIPVAEEALETLRAFGCEGYHTYDVGVAGLHRVLAALPRLREAAVIICVAGMEGALPSVIGGLVACPVIAVPTSIGYGASFKGVAALLGMLNTCAAGVTVVNIDNGFGAAMSALRMIGDKDYPILEVPAPEAQPEPPAEVKAEIPKPDASAAQLERLEKAVEHLTLLAQRPASNQAPPPVVTPLEMPDHRAQLERLERAVAELSTAMASRPIHIEITQPAAALTAAPPLIEPSAALIAPPQMPVASLTEATPAAAPGHEKTVVKEPAKSRKRTAR